MSKALEQQRTDIDTVKNIPNQCGTAVIDFAGKIISVRIFLFI